MSHLQERSVDGSLCDPTVAGVPMTLGLALVAPLVFVLAVAVARRWRALDDDRPDRLT